METGESEVTYIDGHSGVESKEVNRGGSGDFELVLAYLKDSSGAGHFVIHASSNISYSYGLQPREFLEEIGLLHFKGDCPFHHDRCFYEVVGSARSPVHGFENMTRVRSIHDAFRKFSENIGNLYSLVKEEKQLLRELGLSKQSATLFGPPLQIETESSDVPHWVEDIKPNQLKKLEREIERFNSKAEKLRGFLPLVYASGDMLEIAVLEGLRFLGLEAERTAPNFTADILAQTHDGSMRFCLEVTGIEKGIRKDNNKLTQVLEFERIKEHEEKTILLANTFRLLPIGERNHREHFTSQVIDFLRPHPILLMTGWDLFGMICDVLEQKKESEEVVKKLHETSGRLEYQVESLETTH
jgi:hypothetical protein